MNYVMIYGRLGCPAMGVAGASWATIIGQTAAFFIAAAVLLSKRRYIYFDFRDKFSFDRDIMRSIVSIGLPSMLEQLIMRAGIIFYTRMVAGLSETLYATHQICMSVQAMSFMIGQAFGNSVTTLIGQSLGKRRHDMAELYMAETRKLALYVSFVLMAILSLGGRTIVGFYNGAPEVVKTGGAILIMLAATQPFQADQFVVSGGLRGAGDTRYTAFVILITLLGIRTGLCAVLMNVFSLQLWGAWIALAADQCIRTFFMAARYRSGKWKRIAVRIAEGKTSD